MWVIFQVRKVLSLQLSCSILVFCGWCCFASVGHIPLKEILCWWFSKLLLLFAFFLDVLEFLLHSNYLFCVYCDIVWNSFSSSQIFIDGREERTTWRVLLLGKRTASQHSGLQLIATNTNTLCSIARNTNTLSSIARNTNTITWCHSNTYAINSTTRPSVDYAKDWVHQIN